ncbi:MAG TPA: hypothetical protein VJ598_03945 [Albitalea sp.]|nr:hypothetical protein [Albitalea sp.]
MNTTLQEGPITAADLAAAAEVTQRTIEASQAQPRSEDERLAPLFAPDAAQDFRAQWDGVQISFVDDPQQAVRKADELVAQVMKSLADTFSTERAKLEAEVDATEQASTENLRVALRRYRSFFQRLLSL